MSHKSRGTAAERDLIHRFWAEEWAAIRSAGSGSMKYASPDLIVGKGGRRLLIEAKLTSSSKKYISKEDANQLLYFAEVFAGEAWFAIKFPKKPWYFLTPEDMEDTGKNLAMSMELAKLRGLSFEELIND
ncbi:MAG: Holliday junction resolvase Hjc [Patescibacteria group bacterium]|nr:Holliday junction resolvase Hjc [Patescibacteria group bacterium]